MCKYISKLLLTFILLSTAGCPMLNLRNTRSIVSDIEIDNVDMATVVDGIYYGKKNAIMVSEEVWVTVSENEIIDIKLLHKHGRGEKADSITDNVKDKQNLDIEVITGATSSSLVILKAIENALISESVEQRE